MAVSDRSFLNLFRSKTTLGAKKPDNPEMAKIQNLMKAEVSAMCNTKAAKPAYVFSLDKWSIIQKNIKDNKSLTPNEKIACLGTGNNFGTTLAMAICAWGSNNDAIPKYIKLLSDLLDEGADPIAVVDLLNKKNQNKENLALLVTYYNNSISVTQYLDLLITLKEKNVPVEKLKIGLALKNPQQGSFFDVFLTHQISPQIYNKLFETGLLSDNDYKKEAVLKIILGLNNDAEKIKWLTAALNPQSPFGEFFWKKRGLTKPSDEKNTLKQIKEELRKLSPNHPYFFNNLPNQYSAENMQAKQNQDMSVYFPNL